MPVHTKHQKYNFNYNIILSQAYTLLDRTFVRSHARTFELSVLIYLIPAALFPNKLNQTKKYTNYEHILLTNQSNRRYSPSPLKIKRIRKKTQHNQTKLNINNKISLRNSICTTRTKRKTRGKQIYCFLSDNFKIESKEFGMVWLAKCFHMKDVVV